ELRARFLAFMLNSFLVAFTFLSVFPVPKKFLPDWNQNNLRYFCIMIPVTGIFFAAFWFLFSFALGRCENISGTLRGFAMTLATLTLTGGLHMDGLMDTCDAIFSRRDKETRLKILSDTHAGSFAVIGCVIALMSKTFLFAEIFSRGLGINFFIPIFSRLGMAFILNNIKFAKPGGLAVMVGKARAKRNNIFFAAAFIFLSISNSIIISAIFILSLIIWIKICLKTFGGITGDLLGAFLEVSEILFLTGTVIENCI
ncbi:MAG: adenosylcobinamide-GDP ribazoletransferase, partial [Synergistaceae bacterium]|nr:adenosylcobinamide-GDP ribazoletransferase [Synergistaceae bacterium]